MARAHSMSWYRADVCGISFMAIRMASIGSLTVKAAASAAAKKISP